MNVERLHAIVATLILELSDDQTVTRLDQLVSSMQNMVNQPGSPQYQQEVSATLTDLRSSLPGGASDNFTPSRRQTLVELGLQELFGSTLLDRINHIVEANQMTPSVAVDELQPIATRVREVSEHLTSLQKSLDYFEIPSEELSAGEVELAVLIPRQAVDNDLPDLGREFVKIQQIMGPFLEISTGSRPDLQVRSIASSDFALYLDLPLQTAAIAAASIAYLIKQYKSLLEIRRLRQEIADHDVPETALEGIQTYADNHMSLAIETEVGRLTAELTLNGREHELKIDLTRSLTQIALRIDNGYNIDIRVAPDPADDPESQEDGPGVDPDVAAARTVRGTSADLAFIQASGKPILGLTAGLQTDQPDDDGSVPD
jgi:hypothetical protein